jgi:hypothetical protein
MDTLLLFANRFNVIWEQLKITDSFVRISGRVVLSVENLFMLFTPIFQKKCLINLFLESKKTTTK